MVLNSEGMAQNHLQNRPRVRYEQEVTKKARELFARLKEKIAGGSNAVARPGAAVIVVRFLNWKEDEK